MIERRYILGLASVFFLALVALGLRSAPSIACVPCGAASFCPLGPGLCTVCSQCQIPFFPPGSPTTSSDFLGLNSPFQPQPGDANRNPFNGPVYSSNDLITNGLGNDLTTAFQGQSSIAPITEGTVVLPGLPALPGYYYQAPPTSSRQIILGRVRGGGDIARAAELLVQENVMVYDQSAPRDVKQIAMDHLGGVDNAETSELSGQLYSNFVQGANADDLINVTRANCFDFIHFSAYLAGPGTGSLQAGGSQLQDLVDPAKMQEWDGSTEIPRGKIIIGTAREFFGGQGNYGLYHVAVSLGNGMVANNRGAGVSIEPIGDVFGGFYTNPVTGRGIFFGDYVGYGVPDSAKDFLTTERDNNEAEIVLYGNGTLGGDLTPRQRRTVVNDLGNRNAVIDFQLGQAPLPGDDEFTAGVRPYVLFLGQAVSGITNHDPYVITNFGTFTAVQQAPKPPATPPPSSQAKPKAPPEGLELARLFVDYFNISEAGQLPTPQPRGP